MNKVLRTCLCILMFLCGGLSAYAQSITGKVTSNVDQSPAIGVSVSVKGTTNGVITDVEGNYSLELGEGKVLVFSSVGYLTQEVVVENQTIINVILEEDVVGLNEVVVTALGIKREAKSLGYSISEVKSKDLILNQESNVVNALRGRVSGVQVTAASSGAGGSSRVIIRGSNSLGSNNEPLYVVDGVPIDNSSLGNVKTAEGQWDRTDYGSGISDINPDDIESMSILKGPNAAALYGSRAANGVVLITTKKGKSGQGLGISVNSTTTFDNVFILPDYQNEYGQGTNGQANGSQEDILANGGSWGAKLDGSQKLSWTGEQQTYSAQKDNVRDFFETGKTYSNSIAISGGTEKSTFRLSYSNLTNKGFLPNASLDKNNFNFRGTLKVNERLDIDARGTYFIQSAENRPNLGDNFDNPVRSAFQFPRNVRLDDVKLYKNQDGTVRTWNSNLQNPYWTQNYNTKKDSRNRFNGFFKVNYKITDDLSVFGRVGTDYTNFKRYNVNPYYHITVGKGSYNRVFEEFNETNADFLFMYNKDLNEDWKLGLNAGGNIRIHKTNSISNSGSNFILPTVVSPDNIPQEHKGGDYVLNKEKEVQSLYMSGQLAFREYAYLDFSVRNDWSSTLPDGKNSYIYPSASLSLILTDMFEVESDVLSFFKLRSSYSEVGNDTDPYRIKNSYQLGAIVNGKPMVRVAEEVNNPDLKPERTSSYEFGADIRLFEGRVYGDFAYYHILTKDQIIPLKVASTTGSKTKIANQGEVVNKGFEMMLGIQPIKTEDLQWDINFNFTKNMNELKSLNDDVPTFVFADMQLGGGITVWADVNGGFGDILGKDYKRNDAGQIIVNDDGMPLAGDKQLIGNYQPDWMGSIYNTVKYKNFSLAFMIDGRFGGEVYSFTDASLDAQGLSKASLLGREDGIVVDGVKEVKNDAGEVSYEPNTTKITSEEYFGSIQNIASEHMVDATNIRLRELIVSYIIPNKVLSKIGVRNASVSLTGRNLFFLYKKADHFDPESSFSTGNGQGVVYYNLPSTRSYGFNIKFSL